MAAYKVDIVIMNGFCDKTELSTVEGAAQDEDEAAKRRRSKRSVVRL